MSSFLNNSVRVYPIKLKIGMKHRFLDICRCAFKLYGNWNSSKFSIFQKKARFFKNHKALPKIFLWDISGLNQYCQILTISVHESQFYINNANHLKCILESMPKFMIREETKIKAQSTQQFDSFWIMVKMLFSVGRKKLKIYFLPIYLNFLTFY